MRANQAPNFMPGIKIRTTIRNRAGIITSFREEDGHSWTRWAWNMMFSIMADTLGTGLVNDHQEGPGILTARRVDGVISSVDNTGQQRPHNTYGNQGMQPRTAVSAFGIVVGSGDSPFSVNKHQVDGLIPHGSLAGQLLYAAQVDPVVAYDSLTRKWTAAYSRIFNNNSGDTINVNTVGMVTRYGLYGVSDYLMTYDLLEEAKVIENGGQLTVDIDLISPEFTIDIGWPVLGEVRYGGTVVGVFNDRVIVVAPKVGGESANALTYRSPTLSDVATNTLNGAPNTAILMADGASGIGQWCKGVVEGSPALAGYDDWYIPSQRELEFITRAGVHAHLSASPDEKIVAETLWSSTETGINAFRAVFSGGVWALPAAMGQANVHKVRLIRSFSVRDYEPAE